MSDQLSLFIPLTKVDEARREVWGVLAAEENDRSGETFDYASSKPYFEQWSAYFEKATGGKSKGNLRAMHKTVAAGSFIALVFNDELRRIEVGARVVDDQEWAKVEAGVYTGFSIGGGYVKRWSDPTTRQPRYTANPLEGSLVDYPAIASATFQVIKTDHSVELRKFLQETPAMLIEDETPLAKATADVAATPAVAAEDAADVVEATAPPTPAQALHTLCYALGMRCPPETTGVYPPPWSADDLIWQQVHAALVAQGALCPHVEWEAEVVYRAAEGELAKAGPPPPFSGAARKSAQAIHDHSTKIGANCKAVSKAAGERADEQADEADEADTVRLDPPSAPVAKAAELVLGEVLTTLTVPTPDPALFAELDLLRTTVAEQAATLTKAASDQAALGVRLATLEAQPLAGGPILRAGDGLSVVEKTLIGTILTATPPADVDPVLDDLRAAYATSSGAMRLEFAAQIAAHVGRG